MELVLSIVPSWTRTDVGESTTMSMMVLLNTSDVNESPDLLQPHFPPSVQWDQPSLIVPVKAE